MQKLLIISLVLIVLSLLLSCGPPKQREVNVYPLTLVSIEHDIGGQYKTIITTSQGDIVGLPGLVFLPVNKELLFVYSGRAFLGVTDNEESGVIVGYELRCRMPDTDYGYVKVKDYNKGGVTDVGIYLSDGRIAFHETSSFFYGFVDHARALIGINIGDKWEETPAFTIYRYNDDILRLIGE